MLTPTFPIVQKAQPVTKTEKQKENASAKSSVAGQTVESPLSEFLSEFLSDEEMNALIPDEMPNSELDGATNPEDSEALEVITEKLEATEAQIDQEALVADLVESIPALQIDVEQLDVFSPAPINDAATNEVVSGESVVQNLVEAAVETLTETPIDTLVESFVETEDIAKLVSSTTSVWNHIGQKLVEKTILLLKNGMAYTDLTVPPGQLKLPSSLESTVGSAWTTWRQDEETGAIYIGSEENGGETRLTGVEIDLAPISIDDIAGTHTKVEASSWSATQETRWSDVIFHEDGTFEYAVTTVRTTGGYDTQWLESFSQSATYASANRPVVNADGTVDTSNEPPRTNMFGSFKLAEDGLSIELTYANGSIESRLIYKSEGYVRFGESSFKTRQETKEELALWRDKMLALGDQQLLGADWLAVLADSAAAANDNRNRQRELLHAPRNSPG